MTQANVGTLGPNAMPARRRLTPGSRLWRAVLGLLPLLLLGAIAISSLAGDALKENLDLPYSVVVPPEDEEEAPEIISFYGLLLEANCFIFMVSASHNMVKTGELEAAFRETTRAVRELSPKAKLAILIFDGWGKHHTFPPSGAPARATSAVKLAAEKFVSQERDYSNPKYSCLDKAFSKAFEMARQSSTPRTRIVLVSDGQEVCEPDALPDPTYRLKMIGVITAMNTHRVPIDTVSISADGGGAPEHFLSTLATTNDGQYKRVYPPATNPEGE